MESELLLNLPGAEKIGAYDQSELVCLLSAGMYGLGIKSVQEIMPLPEVMPLPQLPQSMMGVCRYRDLIIPVINLPLLLEQSDEHPLTDVWQMVVINEGQRVCGLAVKDINEILSFSLDEMEPMPNVEAVRNEAFYRGIKRMGEQVVMLLKVEEVLNHCQIPTRQQVEDTEQFSQAKIERIGILHMGDLLAGIDIELIERILRTPEVTAVAGAPAGVKGIALNPEAVAESAGSGDYYPVIDLFHFLNVPDAGGKRNLVLSQVAGRRVGYYVGVVEEIRDINDDAFYPIPRLVQTSENRFVRQVFLLGDEIVQLLDLQSVGGEALVTYLQSMSSDERPNNAS